MPEAVSLINERQREIERAESDLHVREEDQNDAPLSQ